jgi:hypothetical protein
MFDAEKLISFRFTAMALMFLLIVHSSICGLNISPLELIYVKQTAGFILGILLLCLSLTLFNYGSSNDTAALSLLIASLLIIGVTELTTKMGKK